ARHADPLDFEAYPYAPAVGGIDGDARRPRNAYVGTLRRNLHSQPLPELARVGRAIDARGARRAGPCEHRGGLDGIDDHAPHHRALHWRIDEAPSPTPVIAAIEALVGS